MEKHKIKPADNSSNLQNRNTGTTGTNLQFDQSNTNRSIQLKKNQKETIMIDLEKFSIEDYIILETKYVNNNVVTLQAQVMEYVAKGYQPIGGAIISDTTLVRHQTMIKVKRKV